MGDFELPLTGVAVTNIGAAVYASDDATLTLTSTANSFAGWVLGVPKANTIVLRLDPYNATP